MEYKKRPHNKGRANSKASTLERSQKVEKKDRDKRTYQLEELEGWQHRQRELARVIRRSLVLRPRHPIPPLLLPLSSSSSSSNNPGDNSSPAGTSSASSSIRLSGCWGRSVLLILQHGGSEPTCSRFPSCRPCNVVEVGSIGNRLILWRWEGSSTWSKTIWKAVARRSGAGSLNSDCSSAW